MLVYVASPYVIGDKRLNVMRSIQAGDSILKRGHTPFLPLLTHFWNIVSPKPESVWFSIDNVILLRCDAVLRLDGGSKGADAEVELAKANGIPVYYDIERIPNE